MRCKACDVSLTDFEATIRCVVSGDFLDLCSRCRAHIVSNVDTTERYDLFDPNVDVVDFDTPDDSVAGPIILSDDPDDGEV